MSDIETTAGPEVGTGARADEPGDVEWGSLAQPASPAPRRSGLARTSLVLGLVGLVGFVAFNVLPVLAVGFGLFALRAIRRPGAAVTGRNEAVAGIALGAVETVVFAVLVATGTLSLSFSLGSSAAGDGEYRGHGIAFDYPANWEEMDEVEVERTSGGADDLFEVGVARADRDLIVVHGYRLARLVTEANMDEAESELNDLMATLVGEDGEVVSGPTGVEVAGLPGLEYTIRFRSDEGAPLHSRFVFVFDGTTEYSVNCQHDRHARQVAEACDQVLDSFRST